MEGDESTSVGLDKVCSKLFEALTVFSVIFFTPNSNSVDWKVLHSQQDLSLTARLDFLSKRLLEKQQYINFKHNII